MATNAQLEAMDTEQAVNYVRSGKADIGMAVEMYRAGEFYRVEVDTVLVAELTERGHAFGVTQWLERMDPAQLPAVRDAMAANILTDATLPVRS